MRACVGQEDHRGRTNANCRFHEEESFARLLPASARLPLPGRVSAMRPLEADTKPLEARSARRARTDRSRTTLVSDARWSGAAIAHGAPRSTANHRAAAGAAAVRTGRRGKRRGNDGPQTGGLAEPR
jgi:hypothetical protein